ncbi:MAG: rpsG [Candidatus Magasanikbacteria bacterium]|nr:rpsG [Candidatus Magasanikbacteria bacterium]
MRGKQAPKREINPDPKFRRTDIAKLINYVMQRGKKSVAQKIVYGAFEIVKEKSKKEPVEIFEEAMKNVGPSVEVKSRRVGGANYQVPIPVRGERRFALGVKWIIRAAANRHGKPMVQKLAEELLMAANGEGDAVKKRNDVHRMAEANKAFAHFAR